MLVYFGLNIKSRNNVTKNIRLGEKRCAIMCAHSTAFLIQIFLRCQKIADVNGDIFRSRQQMCKSRRQIYFSLIAHYQLTSL